MNVHNLFDFFRDPADRGELRTMPTLAVDQLKLQLLQFKEKWEGVTYNGKHVLPPAAIAEIQSLNTLLNLKIHLRPPDITSGECFHSVGARVRLVELI